MSPTISRNGLRKIALAVSIASGSCDDGQMALAASATIDVAFVHIVPRDFRNGRATACNLMAEFANNTERDLSDLTIRVGELQFHVTLAKIHARTRGGWNIGSVELDSIGACAEVARDILKNIAAASAPVCVMDGMAQSECRSLVRISTAMDSAAIEMEGLYEIDQGRWEMHAVSVGIPLEISFITDRLDTGDMSGGPTDTGGTNKVIILNDTTGRFHVRAGKDAGWVDERYEPCATVSILNHRGLTQNHDAHGAIPAGYVWYARPTSEGVRYGQIRSGDIVPPNFVSKCDRATKVIELQYPNLHVDGSPMVLK